MTNRDALNLTVAALRQCGNLDARADALIALASTLADALDDDGGADIAREYRHALGALVAIEQGATDERTGFLRAVSTAMGDETHAESGHVGPGGRRRGRRDRVALDAVATIGRERRA